MLLALLVFTGSTALAQHDVTRTWMFGAGQNALLDKYLSPLDYKGPSLAVMLENERTARWGCGRVSSLALFDSNFSLAHNPSGSASFYDAQITLAMGWHYNWLMHGQKLRLRLGALAELGGGGTYSTRNGNNPAQGRCALDIAPSFIADYTFRSPFRHQTQPWHTRTELDLPILGMMFSPRYGQSYYELFELGHYDRNVCATWPANAPSLRLLTTLTIPVRSSSLVIGYRGDVRQSRVNNLGRHAWENGVIIGFTRHLKF